ncbi:glucosamine-6-phosphate deaminase, partial [Akkermansiaceae bacterium]|nr:glucosamine-6-phosphate deaminase [Akkermansiaceae bacterium]
EGIDWTQVTIFHLDEYVGLSIEHPASFRKYLKERFENQLPSPVRAFHYINAEDDPEAECDRVGSLIAETPIDVAFVGIGENGHLAFNDPPADFEIEKPYLVVNLDEACRQQQFGEGWFANLEAVPEKAISMSVRQIMKSGSIICTVPDERKAKAVRNSLEGEVSPGVPASILQEHEDCGLYIDELAASLLGKGGAV